MAGDSLKDMGRASLESRWKSASLVGRSPGKCLVLLPLPDCIGRIGGKIEQNGIPRITGVKRGGWREV